MSKKTVVLINKSKSCLLKKNNKTHIPLDNLKQKAQTYKSEVSEITIGTGKIKKS